MPGHSTAVPSINRARRASQGLKGGRDYWPCLRKGHCGDSSLLKEVAIISESLGTKQLLGAGGPSFLDELSREPDLEEWEECGITSSFSVFLGQGNRERILHRTSQRLLSHPLPRALPDSTATAVAANLSHTPESQTTWGPNPLGGTPYLLSEEHWPGTSNPWLGTQHHLGWLAGPGNVTAMLSQFFHAQNRKNNAASLSGG